MQDVEAALTATLVGTGLRVLRHQEADGWLIEGLTIQLARKKATRPAMTALAYRARQLKICLFCMIARFSFGNDPLVPTGPRTLHEQRLREWLQALDFQPLGDIGVSEMFGIDAREPTPTLLHFANPMHHQFHRTLIKYGFSFMVSSNLRVGYEYTHPIAPVAVLLKVVDADLEYVCLKPDGTMYGKDAFTANESQWIYDNDSEIECLWRELHVLLVVRPDTMITPPIAVS